MLKSKQSLESSLEQKEQDYSSLQATFAAVQSNLRLAQEHVATLSADNSSLQQAKHCMEDAFENEKKEHLQTKQRAQKEQEKSYAVKEHLEKEACQHEADASSLTDQLLQEHEAWRKEKESFQSQIARLNEGIESLSAIAAASKEECANLKAAFEAEKQQAEEQMHACEALHNDSIAALQKEKDYSQELLLAAERSNEVSLLALSRLLSFFVVWFLMRSRPCSLQTLTVSQAALADQLEEAQKALSSSETVIAQLEAKSKVTGSSRIIHR